MGLPFFVGETVEHAGKVPMRDSRQNSSARNHVVAYDQWMTADEARHEALETATGERLTADAAAAIRGDLEGRIAVVRTAIDFANACPESGPDVDGLIGGAYAISLVRAVRDRGPGLISDLDSYAAHLEEGINALDGWDASSGTFPTQLILPESVQVVLSDAVLWGNHREERLSEIMLDAVSGASPGEGWSSERYDEVRGDGSVAMSVEWVKETATEPADVSESSDLEPTMTPGGRWPAERGHWWRHARAVGSLPRWSVRRRDRSSSDLGEEISAHRDGAAAFATAHAERSEIGENEVVDVCHRRLRGWVLRDSLPRLDEGDIGPEGAEVIRTATSKPIGDAILVEFTPIALLHPFGTGWTIDVVSADRPDYFELVRKVHSTRVDAITVARQLVAKRR